MADQNRNNQTVTWNSGGTTFDGYKLNVTDTASAVASLLQNFQVGGVVKWSVRKDGFITAAGGASITGNSTITGNLTVTGSVTAGSIAGSMVGPVSSTDNTLPRFDGTSGAVLQGSGIVVGDTNNVSGMGTLSCGAISATSLTAASVTATSDAKLKYDDQPILNPLRLVRKIRGLFYRRISDDDRNVGVIAQELRKVVPEMVKKNGKHLSVDYGSGFGLLVEAIKEMADMADRQDKRIRELEGR